MTSAIIRAQSEVIREAIRSTQKPSKALRGTQKPSEANSGTQRTIRTPSDAIRENQRQSAAYQISLSATRA